MRETLIFLTAAICLLSCEMLGLPSETAEGELRISFVDNGSSMTRAGLNIPDTTDFILKVADSKGKVCYEGRYGDSPESMRLSAGTYCVSIISGYFDKPAFSSPQFGDEQYVVVPGGVTVNLRLLCKQINSGIRLKISPDFLEVYPDGVLLLKSSFGRLVYGYSERRVAYFKPGDISLILSDKGNDEVLLVREMDACEVLELKVNVSRGGKEESSMETGNGISVSLDTLRNWINDTYVIGEDYPGGSGSSDAMTVGEALKSIGSMDVWVSGYIVGGDLTSSSASYEKPFSSRTNILIGPRTSSRDRNTCMSVQLPSGELRESLNLVDNPELLGRKVCLKGDIVESYYGIPGIKNITEYELQ